MQPLTLTPTTPGDAGRQIICRLARALTKQTGVWFGPWDVERAIARALRRGQIVIGWTATGGLVIDNLTLAQIGAGLLKIADLENIDADAIRWALSSAMAQTLGLRGGTWLLRPGSAPGAVLHTVGNASGGVVEALN